MKCKGYCFPCLHGERATIGTLMENLSCIAHKIPKERELCPCLYVQRSYAGNTLPTLLNFPESCTNVTVSLLPPSAALQLSSRVCSR